MTKRKPLTPEQKEEIAHLRGERGWANERIARKIGISAGAVSWYCLMDGIEKPGPIKLRKQLNRSRSMVVMRNGHPVRRYTSEDDEKLMKLEAQGLGYSEIGRQLGRKWNSVRARLATLARHAERQLQENTRCVT